MATRYTDEFRRDAVRIAATSGLTRPQIASDLGVGLSTLNKWVQQHQREDLMSGPHEDVEKENIREQHRLSLQSYGRSRMTEELQELGLNVGHRRVGHPLSADLHCKSPAGQWMRENGIKIVRTRKYKVTTDSNHAFNIAPNLLDQDFSADAPNQKCPLIETSFRLSGNRRATYPISGPERAGCIWR